MRWATQRAKTLSVSVPCRVTNVFNWKRVVLIGVHPVMAFQGNTPTALKVVEGSFLEEALALFVWFRENDFVMSPKQREPFLICNKAFRTIFANLSPNLWRIC